MGYRRTPTSEGGGNLSPAPQDTPRGHESPSSLEDGQGDFEVPPARVEESDPTPTLVPAGLPTSRSHPVPVGGEVSSVGPRDRHLLREVRTVTQDVPQGDPEHTEGKGPGDDRGERVPLQVPGVGAQMKGRSRDVEGVGPELDAVEGDVAPDTGQLTDSVSDREKAVRGLGLQLQHPVQHQRPLQDVHTGPVEDLRGLDIPPVPLLPRPARPGRPALPFPKRESSTLVAGARARCRS